MLATLGLLTGALLLVLYAAHLFTNGVEWMGKRLGFSHGMVGSILAAVGTALPETIIPIIAILFSGGEHSHQDVGVGAILGAPFMLTTLTLPLLGAAVLGFSALGRREPRLRLNPKLVQHDLGYFLIGYGAAIATAFFQIAGLRYVVACFLIGLYGHYVWRLRRLDLEHPADDDLIAPLIFSRRSRPGGRQSPTPAWFPIAAQIVTGLVGIVAGAHFFVEAIDGAAAALAVQPLLLSLMITPIATELPEKFNSLIWIAQRKDGLAVANITGAMVFQATFPVSVGLIGTPWQLDWHGLTTAICALAAAAGYFLLLARQRRWHPWQLIIGVVFYLGFGIALLLA